MPKNNTTQALMKKAATPAAIAAAAASGGLYFFIAAEGAKNLQKLGHMDIDYKDLGIGLGSGAAICYAAFTYKVMSNLTLKPNSPLSYILSALAPIAASSFYIAGKDGAGYMGIEPHYATAIGVLLFASRSVTLVDSSVKFPEKAKELFAKLNNAIATKDWKKISRLTITLFTALGFSLASTDAIYATVASLLTTFGATDKAAVEYTSYVSGGLGSIAFFPITMYWTHRGLNQLTFGGEQSEEGVNPDPSDRYTLIALLLTIPVILGCLGSVTSADGEMFARAGSAGLAIRIMSALIFAITGAVPGLSSMARTASNSLHGFFQPASIEVIDHEAAAEEQPLFEEGKGINYSQG